MQNKSHKLTGETWIGLILILFTLAMTVLNFEAQSPTQQFVYGLLTGMLVVLFGVLIYRAAKDYSSKDK